MPPAVSPQSSRAGLITSMVSSIVVAVVAIVFAFYYAAQNGKLEQALNQRLDQDKTLVPEGAASDQRIQALIALRDRPEFSGAPTAIDVAMMQADQLAKLVAGSDTPTDRAMAVGRAALEQAGKRLGELNTSKLGTFAPPAQALAPSFNTLLGELVQLANDKKGVEDQLAAANQKLQDEIAARNKLLADRDAKVAEANAAADKARQEAEQYHQEAQRSAESIQASAQSDIRKLQQAADTLNKQIADETGKIRQLEKDRIGLQQRLHLVRVNPNESIIQHPDGVINRLVDKDTVFINIGRRQSVTTGLTFEVYDKNRGIPPLGESAKALSDTELPVGKASIEVFNVFDDSSECHVIKLAEGQHLEQGDLIMNLVFDPNIHYTFFVYGDFDLSNSGVSSPGDADVIRRMIIQWGGRISDRPVPDVNTDFVVMGKEPTVSSSSVEASGDNIEKIEQGRQQSQKQKAYDAVIAEASRLSIPIMNQNRFLYFTGFYDQAKR
jgi:hypothetical protein